MAGLLLLPPGQRVHQQPNLYALQATTARLTATTHSKTTKNPVCRHTYINRTTRARSHINRGFSKSYVGRYKLHTIRNGGPPPVPTRPVSYKQPVNEKPISGVDRNLGRTTKSLASPATAVAKRKHADLKTTRNGGTTKPNKSR